MEKGLPIEELLMRNSAEFNNSNSHLPTIKLSVTELETASLDLQEGRGLPAKRPSGGVYHA